LLEPQRELLATSGRKKAALMNQTGIWIVDSLGETLARLEGESTIIEVPRDWLPASSGEGDVLSVSLLPGPEVVAVQIIRSPDALARRVNRVREIRGKVRRGPRGDLEI
jgi:hypothetical protein